MRRVDATAYAVQSDALEVIVTTQEWGDIEAVTIVIDGQLNLASRRSQGSRACAMREHDAQH